MLRRQSLFLLAMLVAVQAGAQRRLFRAPLPAVSGAGFYKVLITPEVTAHSRPDLHDLRIKDRTGRDVPYLRSFDADAVEEKFHPFAINRSKSPSGSTRVDIRNDLTQSIEALFLLVRNTGAQRTASVSGSLNGTTFYSLRDSVALQVADGRRTDTTECIIPLPRTSYPFLRLEIFDRGLLPLDVLGAGAHLDQLLSARYTELPAPRFTQTDSSDRKSYIRLRFAKRYPVQRIYLQFAGPPLFKREGTLSAYGFGDVHFTTNHTQPTGITVLMHATDALLVIDNEDNPPLRLTSVSAWQRRQHLLAYLEAGTDYTLHFGDSSLPPPVYDLHHFRDSITGRALLELRPGGVEEIAVGAPAVTKASKPFIGSGTLWVVILLVMAGLISATVGLVRQIKKKG